MNTYVSPHSGYEQFGYTTDILLLMLPLVMLAIIWVVWRILESIYAVIVEAGVLGIVWKVIRPIVLFPFALMLIIGLAIGFVIWSIITAIDLIMLHVFGKCLFHEWKEPTRERNVAKCVRCGYTPKCPKHGCTLFVHGWYDQEDCSACKKEIHEDWMSKREDYLS